MSILGICLITAGVVYIEDEELHAKFIDNMAKYGKSYAT
jgi:hypothetical protein